MLLRMKGLETAFAEDLERVSELMQSWAPAVLLLDTRLDTAPDYSFARQCRANAAGGHLLLIAMSNFVPMEPVEDLKLAGFDGHMRRPVETWRMIDVLTTFLEYSAMSRR
jgi:CheY-like chemotaxis protein